jgi:peptidyl-prolyl cis-trans isomerase SurA
MRLSARTTLPAVLALAALAGACRSGPASTASPADVPPDVWAVVDGRQIHQEEVEKAYRRAIRPDATGSPEEATATKLNVLDQLITQDLLVAKANELQITLPESDLDAALTAEKQKMTDEAFNQELAARNLTAADMREALRRDLLAQKVIAQEVSSKITVTDQEIRDFFDANKAQFNLPEDAYHIAQIVVTSSRDAGLNNRTGDDATTPQAAAAKVQMLMDRLASGAPFNELAMDYSEDPQSAPQGGDVGLVPASALRQAPAPLRDAVMKLEPGSVTVASMEGGHTIVALVAKQAAGQRDLSMPDVRSNIEGMLRARRGQLLQSAYIEMSRNQATIVNYVVRRLVESQGKLPPTLAAPAPGR